MQSNMLSAASVARMITRLGEIHAFVSHLPANTIPVAQYDAWINARAMAQVTRDELIRVSCTAVAVEPVTQADADDIAALRGDWVNDGRGFGDDVRTEDDIAAMYDEPSYGWRGLEA